MTSKLVSIFFIALVCSSLGHEYLKAQHLTHRLSHEGRHHNNLLSQFRAVTNPPSNCQWQCTGPKPVNVIGDLDLVFNANLTIIGLVNSTAQIAIAFDLQFELVAVFDGNNGAIVVIDINTGSGVYIKGGASGQAWLAAQVAFNVYINALGSLKAILSFSGAVSFTVQSASQEIITIVGGILAKLSADLAAQLKVNASVGLVLLINVSVKIIGAFNGGLAILIKGSSNLVIRISGDLSAFVAVTDALVALGGRLVGGFEALIVADVQFKLSLLLAASSGIEIFIALLVQVSEHVNLAVVLQNLISSPEVLLEVIVSLGGGCLSNVNGVVAVVYGFLQYANGKIKIEVVIDLLIRVSGSGVAVAQASFVAIVSQLVVVIQSQIAKYQTSAQFQAILVFLSNLKAGQLVVGGVNISGVVSVLAQGSLRVGIVVVLGVLVAIQGSIGLGVTVPTLIYRIFVFVNSSFNIGVKWIVQLFPSVQFGIDWSSSQSVLVQILSKVSLISISRYLITLDIYGLITHIPVFGGIVTEIESAWKVVAQSGVSISSIISSGATSLLSSFVSIVKVAISGGGGEKVTWGIGVSISVNSSSQASLPPRSSSGGVSGSGGITSSGGGNVSGGASVTGSGGATVTGSGGASVSGSGSATVSVGGGASVSSGGGWSWGIGSIHFKSNKDHKSEGKHHNDQHLRNHEKIGNKVHHE